MWISLLVVSRAVGDPAVVSLLPAARVPLHVAERGAGLVRDAQGALALLVAALRVVVLWALLARLVPLGRARS